MGNGTSSLRNGQSFLLKSLCETSRFTRNGFFALETETAVKNNSFVPSPFLLHFLPKTQASVTFLVT